MNTNEFKVNRETYCASVVLLEESCELPLEKDFVLPDYYPDIFRILKCIVMPRVQSQNINGNKLTIETSALVRVLYCSENDSKVSSIEQKLTFTKSFELKDDCTNPSVSVEPHCDYINCRVVNQRRLDVRGAVTEKIKVCGEKRQPVVTDASGCNIQLKKKLMTYPSKRLCAMKRVTVIEDLELNSSKPAVVSVIRTNCIVTQSEQKIIAGKLVTKGDADISMLYTCVNSSGEDGLENMKFTIPFSQIIDIDGIDETYESNVEITAAFCEIMPKGESQTSLECELILNVDCKAVKYETGEVVTDAYSTCYECDIESAQAKLECMPVKINDTHSGEANISYTDEDLCCVYDSWAEVENVSVRFDEEKRAFVVAGNVRYSVLAKNESSQPLFLETETPFEHEIAAADNIADLCSASCEPRVCVTNCSYHMTDNNNIELKSELRISGQICAQGAKQLLSELKVCTDKPKQRKDNYALKLCYCTEKDDIWQIAKKYSTSINAIMEENELTDDKVSQQGMLLIPLMN